MTLVEVLLYLYSFSNKENNFLKMIHCILTYSVGKERRYSPISFDSIEQFNAEIPKHLKNKTHCVCFILQKGNLRFFSDFLDKDNGKDKPKKTVYMHIVTSKMYSESIVYDWIKPIKDVLSIERTEFGMYQLHTKDATITVPEINFKKLSSLKK